MQQLGEPGRMQSAINVTPLVDVVLVLLIIFMVMAPYMNKGPGPEVDLPATEKPRDQSTNEAKVQVTIDEHGGLWIDDAPVLLAELGEGLRAAVGEKPDTRIVIRADARLSFSEVRRTMLAVDEAGFHGVGLIAERASAEAGGD